MMMVVRIRARMVFSHLVRRMARADCAATDAILTTIISLAITLKLAQCKIPDNVGKDPTGFERTNVAVAY
jgi:hypothetical protein